MRTIPKRLCQEFTATTSPPRDHTITPPIPLPYPSRPTPEVEIEPPVWVWRGMGGVVERSRGGDGAGSPNVYVLSGSALTISPSGIGCYIRTRPGVTSDVSAASLRRVCGETRPRATGIYGHSVNSNRFKPGSETHARFGCAICYLCQLPANQQIQKERQGRKALALRCRGVRL
jgi:hypothetical protein